MPSRHDLQSADNPHVLAHYAPPDTPLDIIYEDTSLLILNKPGGLLTVPGKNPEHKDCLESRAQAYCQDARIVHRLDWPTSGLVVMAKTKEAHRHLGLQFEKRYIKKRYEALVEGRPDDEEGQIDLPLICDWPNRPRQMVDHEHGKPALTRWQLGGQVAPNIWHMRLFPKTGRSHQLRVHLMTLGCPIIGDHMYAPDKEPHISAPRMMLHASEITLKHPEDGNAMEFQSSADFLSGL